MTLNGVVFGTPCFGRVGLCLVNVNPVRIAPAVFWEWIRGTATTRYELEDDDKDKVEDPDADEDSFDMRRLDLLYELDPYTTWFGLAPELTESDIGYTTVYCIKTATET